MEEVGLMAPAIGVPKGWPLDDQDNDATDETLSLHPWIDLGVKRGKPVSRPTSVCFGAKSAEHR